MSSFKYIQLLNPNRGKQIKAREKYGDPINPNYYKQHPSGIEAIVITRQHNFDIGNAIKYLWRQGLKNEEGIDNITKSIEDCRKAIWYIKDHRDNWLRYGLKTPPLIPAERFSLHPSGIDPVKLVNSFDSSDIGNAIGRLCSIGFINATYKNEGIAADIAISYIKSYINTLEKLKVREEQKPKPSLIKRISKWFN